MWPVYTSAVLVPATSSAISTPTAGTYILPTEHPQPLGRVDKLKGSVLKLSQLHGLPQLASKNRNRNKLFFWKYIQLWTYLIIRIFVLGYLIYNKGIKYI